MGLGTRAQHEKHVKRSGASSCNTFWCYARSIFDGRRRRCTNNSSRCGSESREAILNSVATSWSWMSCALTCPFHRTAVCCWCKCLAWVRRKRNWASTTSCDFYSQRRSEQPKRSVNGTRGLAYSSTSTVQVTAAQRSTCRLRPRPRTSCSCTSSSGSWSLEEARSYHPGANHRVHQDRRKGQPQRLVEKERHQTEVLHMESLDGEFAHREITQFEQTEHLNDEMVHLDHGREEFLHLKSRHDEISRFESSVPPGGPGGGGRPEECEQQPPSPSIKPAPGSARESTGFENTQAEAQTAAYAECWEQQEDAPHA